MYVVQVIVLCLDAPGSGCSLQDVCELAQQPGWWALPAVRQGLVFICPSAYFTTPGPRYASFLPASLVQQMCCEPQLGHT